VIGFFRRLSDERYRRATKRRRTEEIMGWVCVPVLIVIGWYAFKGYEQISADRRAPTPDQVMPANLGTASPRR
jgi:hypothetical protein